MFRIKNILKQSEKSKKLLDWGTVLRKDCGGKNVN